MKFILLTVLILALIGITGASTVTLTGTCYSKTINQTNDYIQFNLTNSGNGTATNLLIAPIIEGASTNNTTISVPLVAPGGTYNNKIFLYDFGIPGSYVERFVARYSQGTSTFITLFPCLVNLGQNAQSVLAISSFQKGSSTIEVNVSNIANYPINAQVSIYAPPEFNISNSTRNVTIKGSSLSDLSFPITTPQYTNAEFPISIAVSYVLNNVHYADLSVTTIEFGGSSGSIFSAISNNVLIIGLSAIILIIIILIIISIVVKKHQPHQKEGTSS